MDKKKTGNLIREARQRKNYTQSELGRMLGVTNKAVSRWENGESFPDIGVLESLSHLLELPIQDIVTGERAGDREEAVTEVVRLAKLQEQRKREKRILYLIVLGLLIYHCVIGICLFSGRGLFGGTLPARTISKLKYMIPTLHNSIARDAIPSPLLN